jgi:hypothetical protein
MALGKLKVKVEDLATVIAGLVKEGVCFDSSPCVKDDGYYIVELSGNC